MASVMARWPSNGSRSSARPEIACWGSSLSAATACRWLRTAPSSMQDRTGGVLNKQSLSGFALQAHEGSSSARAASSLTRVDFSWGNCAARRLRLRRRIRKKITMRNPHHRVWANLKKIRRSPRRTPGCRRPAAPARQLPTLAIRKGIGMGGCPPQTCYVDKRRRLVFRPLPEVAINWNAAARLRSPNSLTTSARGVADDQPPDRSGVRKEDGLLRGGRYHHQIEELSDVDRGVYEVARPAGGAASVRDDALPADAGDRILPLLRAEDRLLQRIVEHRLEPAGLEPRTCRATFACGWRWGRLRRGAPPQGELERRPG